jgi:2-keto-4-pentenoate hydratase/2-oxohepta-3-ene-1,7-dioic acid hydratase in catechol pathway
MKIICVGRNYAEHAQELQNEVPRDPVLFLKPETAIILPRNPFFIPDFSEDVHYEAELVVRINRLGKHIPREFARKYYDQITVGIDFTARDLQAKLKEKGLPWEKAKAFDGSAAVGRFVKLEALPDQQHIEFSLKQNGETRQEGNSAMMLFDIDQLIAYISTFFTLKIGDLIFTGTPAGVGKVVQNDRLEVFMFQEKLLSVNVK